MAQKKRRKPQPVLIVWVDAVAEAGWESNDREPELHECWTLGWLISSNQHGYRVAATIGGDEHNATINIPKAWVRRLEKLPLK